MHLEMPQENQTRKWTLNSIFLYWIKEVKHIDENIFFPVQRKFWNANSKINSWQMAPDLLKLLKTW